MVKRRKVPSTRVKETPVNLPKLPMEFQEKKRAKKPHPDMVPIPGAKYDTREKQREAFHNIQPIGDTLYGIPKQKKVERTKKTKPVESPKKDVEKKDETSTRDKVEKIFKDIGGRGVSEILK